MIYEGLDMAHIVILGAGVGGLPCAFEMKAELSIQLQEQEK